MSFKNLYEAKAVKPSKEYNEKLAEVKIVYEEELNIIRKRVFEMIENATGYGVNIGYVPHEIFIELKRAGFNVVKSDWNKECFVNWDNCHNTDNILDFNNANLKQLYSELHILRTQDYYNYNCTQKYSQKYDEFKQKFEKE